MAVRAPRGSRPLDAAGRTRPGECAADGFPARLSLTKRQVSGDIASSIGRAHEPGPGGLFLLAWGLGASALGLGLVTNFRGFADNFSRQADASSAGRRKLLQRKSQWPQTPAERTRLVRLIAMPFAILGPILTVVGLISISHKNLHGSEPAVSPSPFRYLFVVFAVASVGWSWLAPRGMFRPQARHSGWRLAVALLTSLSVLAFGVGIALGQSAIAFIALIVGGVPSVLLLMDGKPTRSGPEGGT